MSEFSVLHFDLGKSFRGGQRQTYNLIKYLRQNGIDCGCVVAAGGSLEQHLIDIGVATFPIQYSGFDIVGESMRLRRSCKELGYKLLHAHDSHGHNLALTIKFISPEMRIVVTRRVLSGKSKTMISRFKYTSPSIDLFIAVSSAVERELLAWGVSDRRIIRIPSGVDMSYFRKVAAETFLSKYSIPSGKHYIGTACALDDNKDVATLINAVAKLSYQNNDCILLVAGDGEGLEELERLVKFIELEGKVFFIGRIVEMPEFYSALQIYCLSSRSEGLGTSLIEAGACGSALVASDCGGTRDVIRDGQNGYMFPVENDERLSRILLKLIENRDERERIVKAFADSIDVYDIESVCAEVMRHYNRIAQLT
jgi:glycosyltransferase involved in cell wall biosynthesis